MKDDLKVSFVVPGYKCDDFLDRNISSLFDQDYQNWEAIIVLNGEWKTKDDLIKSLQDKYGDKIKLISIKEPGLGNANNYGFNISRGDIISHLSSDLYLMPGALRNWIEAFQEHPEVGLVYSGYKLVSRNPLDIYYSAPYDRYHLECENFIDGANPVRRQNWKPFSTDLKSLIDWDWALSVTDDGTKAHFIKEPLYYAELPQKGGLSEDSSIYWVKRRRAVQEKHNIPDRKICVTSLIDPDEALSIAKLVNADFRLYPGYQKHDYRLIYAYGFMANEDNIQRSTGIFFNHYGHKIIHWIGPDIISFIQMRWIEVDYYSQMVLNQIKNHWCMTKKDEDFLRRLHLDPEIIYPPFKAVNLSDEVKELSVSVNEPDLKDQLQKAMPDIDFRDNDPNCKITVHFDDKMSNIIRSICKGNFVITNKYLPGIYHIHGFTNIPELRKMLVHTIRQIKRGSTEPNEENIKFFKEKIEPGYFKNKLERISEKHIQKYAKLEDIKEDVEGVFN